MVDTPRRTVHSKVPVSPGMYRSSYKRDYQWCHEYKLPNEDMKKLQITDSQLRAKEFARPREERVRIHSNRVVGERREVLPPLSIKSSSRADDAGGRRSEGNASGPKASQHFPSVLPVAKSSIPKHHPATKLAATQEEQLERLQALAEPEKELSHCQHLPAAAQATGTAGLLPRRQKLTPNWATYQQFAMEVSRAGQHDAQQNRRMILGSSILLEECFDLDWRSTYNTAFQRWPGAHGGHRRVNKNLSHIFATDGNLNGNYWASEYTDNYNIFLQKPRQSSQNPAAGLCSGPPCGKGIVMDTAQ